MLEAVRELSIFLKRDHGALVGPHCQARHAVQYDIGNPLPASTMTRYGLAGKEHITKVARELDVALGRALSAAAG
jgi:hypothetical protein